MEIVKKIPIKSHLKKWLFLQHEVKDDRIILSPEHRLSQRLYSLFQYYPLGTPEVKPFHAKDYLNVVLTEYLIKHHRTHVAAHKVIYFNDWVGRQFNEDLFTSLQGTGKRKGDKKIAIEQFMDKYNLIEGEDINYDSLKRSYDRYLAKEKAIAEQRFLKGGELQIIVNL